MRPILAEKSESFRRDMNYRIASSDNSESDLLRELPPQMVVFAGYSGNTQLFWIRITGPTLSTLTQCF